MPLGLFLFVFYLHRSYPHSFKLWEIWRPLSDERYKAVKERGGKGGQKNKNHPKEAAWSGGRVRSITAAPWE